MCDTCEKYLCLWNRIFNLITYYQNIITLNPNLATEKVNAINNIIAMLTQKKTLVEKIMTDLKCPGFLPTTPTTTGGTK